VSLFKAPDLQTVQVSKVPEQVSHFGAQGVQSLKFSSKYPLKQSQLVVNEISLVGEYKQEIHVDASVQLAHFL
jgi:hypothetical protein